MQGILLVSEDMRAMTPLQSALVRAGYRVAMSPQNDDSMLEVLGDLTPDVLIADCRPNADCATESRRLLATDCNLKELLVVALLTAEQSQDMDWAGVDEFMIEPYSGDELLARLRLLFWRTKKISSDQAIKIGDLIIDMLNYEVAIAGVPVELTFKEYELLKFLATHRGRVFTREALLDHVWGYDYYGGTRTVDVHIRRLRSKLGPDCENLIETVRNVGYRFSS